MKKTYPVVIVIYVLMLSVFAYAQNPSDYLILQDIGGYIHKVQTKDIVTLQTKTIPGYTIWNNAGILMATGHFLLDHRDTTYSTVYDSDVTDLGVRVQVTQHTGSDSDKWLLHEVERGYRKSRQMHSVYISANPLRTINNNKIFYTWGYYTWMSNNVVVYIQFTDMTGTKPEPLEVVQAYLQKFPSTISSTLVLDQAHSIQWIKDEMERRLWLCDKWFTALQQGKAEIKTVLQNTVDSMTVFLDYREKYFGIKAQDEKNLLSGYLSQNNGTAIKNKLTEYKNWWNENKGKGITING